MANITFESAFEAMYHEKYDFSDFISGDISKRVKKRNKIAEKIIYEADPTLKTYHKFLNLFVLQWLKYNESCVYSYRKGFNVSDAVKKHSAGKYFFQTDLNNFFGSLSTELVRKCIIQSIESIPISDTLQYVDRILDMITIDGWLPVGYSTSPLISNACLLEFDDLLENFCRDHGFTYTRYSDDIIISGGNKELYNIKPAVEAILKQCFGDTLSLNSAKTKFNSIGNRVIILGMMILPNGSITIDSKLKNEIEVLLHFYTKDREKFLDKINTESNAALTKISGYLNYINTTDKIYLDKLRRKYGTSVVDMFVRGSVKSL